MSEPKTPSLPEIPVEEPPEIPRHDQYRDPKPMPPANEPVRDPKPVEVG